MKKALNTFFEPVSGVEKWKMILAWWMGVMCGLILSYIIL
jgi:hypothetical protein